MSKKWVGIALLIFMVTANLIALFPSNGSFEARIIEGNHILWAENGKLYYNSGNRNVVVPGTENDIVANVKYITEENNIYAIYQDYSVRCGEVKYIHYDGKWSKPLSVGRDYGAIARYDGKTYIISSDMEKVYLTKIGIRINTKVIWNHRAVATAIGILDGELYAFWADIRGNVYDITIDKPQEIQKVYSGAGSVYRLSVEKGELKVIERKDGYEMEKTFAMRSKWSLQSSKILTSPLRTSSGFLSSPATELQSSKSLKSPIINRGVPTRSIADEFHQRQNETGRWVMIVYLDGDNNLGDDGSEYDVGDLNEMESAYDDNDVGLFDIVVLWDHKGSDDPNTHVLWIRHDTTGKETTDSVSTVTSPKLDEYYPLLANDADHELYLSNYSVFVDFVEWAVKNFPAEHYFVDLWDHGGGYSGVIWDDDAGGDSWGHDHITIGDMHDASLQLYNDIYPTLGRTLDIIGYDTCLTDHGGIQYHNKIMFDYVGASEHTEGGYGWSYDTVLSEMIQNQGEITADKQAYNLAYHVNDDGGIVTYAVINTTLWDYKWMPAYNALAQAMKHKAGSENKGISDAFKNSADADSSYWTSAHDYWDMINNHIIGDGEISDSTILYWAHRCVDNMTRNSGSYSPGKLIPYSQDTDTNGKKLMMAESTDSSEISNHAGEAWIFQENQWDEMISHINSKSDVNNEPPTVEITSPADHSQVSKTQGVLRIQGTASDSDGSVEKVQVKIDRGYWQDATGTDNWYYDWDISNMPYGWHHIMVRAYDGEDFSWEWKSIDVNIIESNIDLTITDTHLSSSTVNEGDTITIYATVKNVGNEDANNVYVGFYYDSISPSTHIGNVSVGTLSSGMSDDVSITWNTANHAGQHTIFAVADPDNIISETNENNNTGTTTVAVNGYGVQLSVDSSAKSVQPGGSVDYTITVKNTGTLQDTFDLSTSSTSNGWTATLSSNKVTLDAGASTTVTLTVTAPSNANNGDSQNIVVTAISEGDNSKSDSVTTTTTATTLSVTSIKIFNNIEAVVNFTTSSAVKAYIVYGIGPNHMDMQTSEEITAKEYHEIALQNLTPKITYYFKIHMTDGSINAWSSVYNFTSTGFNDLEANDNPSSLHHWEVYAWNYSSHNSEPSIWQWGSPSNVGPSSAHSGSDLIGTVLNGDYGVDEQVQELMTPWIDLRRTSWVTLSFYAWYDLEKDSDGMWDGVTIKFENDAGNVLLLDPNNNASQYDGKSVSDQGLNNTYIFGGSSNGWVLKTFNTSAINDPNVNKNLLGHKVRFIFYFESDEYTHNYPGFYFDDVKIEVGIPLYHIYGYVKDSSGNTVANAQVWINDTTLGISYKVTTDSSGRYDVYTYNGINGDHVNVDAMSNGQRGSNSSTLSDNTEIDITIETIPELSWMSIVFITMAIGILVYRKRKL